MRIRPTGRGCNQANSPRSRSPSGVRPNGIVSPPPTWGPTRNTPPGMSASESAPVGSLASLPVRSQPAAPSAAEEPHLALATLRRPLDRAGWSSRSHVPGAREVRPVHNGLGDAPPNHEGRHPCPRQRDRVHAAVTHTAHRSHRRGGRMRDTPYWYDASGNLIEINDAAQQQGLRPSTSTGVSCSPCSGEVGPTCALRSSRSSWRSGRPTRCSTSPTGRVRHRPSDPGSGLGGA